MSRSYKVLQGFFGSAGQPGALARELRKMGIQADSYLVGNNKFSYESDQQFPDRNHSTFRAIIAENFSKYDIIHIHSLPPFRTKGSVQFPMGLDILAAKAMGKRVIVHFRGSEIRHPAGFSKHSPYNYVEENPKGIFDTFNDEWVGAYIRMCRALADEIVVVDPELQTYVPTAKIIQRSIELEKWTYVGLKNDDRPLVVHAPSRGPIKGTQYVLHAIDTLKAEGLNFDFRLIQGLSNKEAREIYEKADIILDQFRIGWYGVLATEGMALGKCVVSYIREDLVHFLGRKQPPVAIANPDTLAGVLRNLISNPSLRKQQADCGHKFCLEHHDSKVVAEKVASMYDEVLARPTTIDIGAYMQLVGEQEENILAAQDQARLRGRKLGFESGREAGIEAGKEIGFAKGREVGFAKGKEVGFAKGKEAGIVKGRERGYAKAKRKYKMAAVPPASPAHRSIALRLQESNILKMLQKALRLRSA